MKTMIRIHLIVIIVIIDSSQIHGQMFDGFGIKGGFTSSNIDMYYNDYNYDPLNRLKSFHVAIFKEVSLKLPIMLNIEFGYSTKGFKLYEIGKDNVKIDCASFKVLGKYIYYTESVNPFLSIGPRVDYIFNKRADLNINSENDVPFDWENYFTDFSFGLSTQIGVEYKVIENISIITELSFNYDLTNSKNSKSAHVTYFRINSYDISLGVKF
jgi:hypothetical protein